MAALYYHPAAGKASREAVAPSLRSLLALRPSQSKVLCISSSRWWLGRRRWEGKASGISISSRARARPVARPALFSPVAMEWQECTSIFFTISPGFEVFRTVLTPFLLKPWMVLTRQGARRLASTLSSFSSHSVQEEEPEPEEMEVNSGGNAPAGSEGSEGPPPPPDMWVVTFHHHDGGNSGFPMLLRMLFERLNYPVEIEYCGRRRTHPNYPEDWEVAVYIREPEYEYGGTKEATVHHAIAMRSTFEVGIQDAARRALSVLCHEEAAEVRHTAWAYLPRRQQGTPTGVVPQPPGVNSTLNVQVAFTQMLNVHADDTTRELQEVREELAAERRKNKRLIAELKGEALPPLDEDIEGLMGHSPPR